MQILGTSDATTLNYWLNLRVLICAIWVLTPMFIGLYMIWKYECLDCSESEKITQQERSGFLYHDEAWRPCLKEIHPVWLLVFRVIAFFLLLGTIIADVVVHGCSILYYYTQWTFILVTIYFGFGSLLSIYGCYQNNKMCVASNGHYVGIDAEQGLSVPLTYRETAYRVRVEKNSNHQEKNGDVPMIGILCHAFQVIFQVYSFFRICNCGEWENRSFTLIRCGRLQAEQQKQVQDFQVSAGAVMLTDCVYWFVIFPFLTIKDYDMNSLTILTHTLNAVMLLGDTALNCLRFPWFRISYFTLWTGVYVIFQWIVHACIPLWWPYPFLDLSMPNAPIWYLLVALMHIPCYGAFALIMKLKHCLLSRWFPQSYQSLR